MLRSKPLQKRSGLKRSPLRKVGRKQEEWRKFRNEKAARDRDEKGLLWCQCDKLGFEPCHRASESLDLHHIISRNARPDLYYTESNLVWLSRSCHMKAHKQL
nr:MAG TPA: NinG protein [Caudoviricetes sp.]